MHRPQFVTFTGADDKTDFHEMRSIERDYPVEWGILYSGKRAGTARYPTRERFEAFGISRLTCSAHICGADAKVIAHLGNHRDIDIRGYKRAQVNIFGSANPFQVGLWAGTHNVRAILQAREDVFPEDAEVDWLYDTSGGRGETPTRWPRAVNPQRLVGYAGGLGPGYDWSLIADAANGAPYWIDMETKVRNEQDEFDLSLCVQVLEEIYG